MKRMPGSIVVRNDSGETYVVEELGDVELEPSEEIDLLGEDTPNRYEEWSSANRLVTSLPTAKLYQDIQSGIVSVTTNEMPRKQEGE